MNGFVTREPAAGRLLRHPWLTFRGSQDGEGLWTRACWGRSLQFVCVPLFIPLLIYIMKPSYFEFRALDGTYSFLENHACSQGSHGLQPAGSSWLLCHPGRHSFPSCSVSLLWNLLSSPSAFCPSSPSPQHILLPFTLLHVNTALCRFGFASQLACWLH